MVKLSRKLTKFIYFVIVILIVCGTIKKVYENHIDREYLVIEKEIKENAKKCFIEEICTNNETTIKFLISSGYITKQIDPVSKEYIDENTLIKYENNECTLKIR